MLVRSCWKPQTIEEAYKLITAYPWARLVTNGAGGPVATSLPLLLDRSQGEHGVLIGHLSRANPHLEVLRTATEPSLALFEGPASYITPTWYPGRDMPGTFYYSEVHCHGHLRFQNDDELEASLAVLNEQMEAAVPNGWQLSEIPHSEVTRRLPVIIGIVLVIERLEAKLKLGQDEPLADVLAVADHLAAQDDPVKRQLAEMVRLANRNREPESAG